MTNGDPEPVRPNALVITVSDGVAAGHRRDIGGDGVANRLQELGYAVGRAVVPDEQEQIEVLLVDGAEGRQLILTTGGTGLTARDVTPQATLSVISYEVPGLPELMRAAGGQSTPFAYLSRARAGVLNGCLIVNLPGSPRGALESLGALESVLDHAMATLAGPFDHDRRDRDGPPTDGSETYRPVPDS